MFSYTRVLHVLRLRRGGFLPPDDHRGGELFGGVGLGKIKMSGMFLSSEGGHDIP